MGDCDWSRDPERLVSLSHNRDPTVGVVAFDEIDRTVGRSVVDYNDFEVLEGLSEHTLKSLVDIAQRVIGANGDADQRPGHGYVRTDTRFGG
jgi:hypothetical protein